VLRSNSKSLGNHVVSPEEEKERLQWEGFTGKEGFKSGMKDNVGDGKLIIISITVSGINDHIRFYSSSCGKTLSTTTYSPLYTPVPQRATAGITKVCRKVNTGQDILSMNTALCDF